MREKSPAAFLELFRTHPEASALFLDFDGTLSEIAPTPEGARLHPRAAEEVARLAGVYHLCIISGRPAGELSMLVPLDGISLVGLHGLEWWEGGEGGTLPGAGPYLEIMGHARGFLLERGLESMPGVILEDKGLILALHFRLAPERRQEVEALAREAAGLFDLGMHRGRQVVELRPPFAFDKGKAVEMMVERQGAERAVYVGDDYTDVSAFRALRGLESGGFSGLAVAVLSAESPPELRGECDTAVDGVEGVVAFLATL